jgi:hypothetical protein
VSNEDKVPRVAILGWCDRATRIEGTHPALSHINIQGLTQTRFSHFFPTNIKGTNFVVGVYNPRAGESFLIEFRQSDGSLAFNTQLTASNLQQFDGATSEYRELDSTTSPRTGWMFLTIQISDDVLILKPDSFEAFLKSGNQEHYLGTFHLLHASLPLYTLDQIAALRTDPLARTMVRLAYSCSECRAKLQVYAALERSKKQEEEGWSWFAELGDEFRCSCGKMAFSLEYLSTGLHGLLSRNLSSDDQAAGAFLRLYETTKLEENCRVFRALLEKSSTEQEIQDFLESNPVFFARFSAHRLIPKPRIQSKYVADFAILNQRKELVLIEIERGNLRLLTKERRITADLQHAVTQVTDWIQEVNDHKAAVLNSLRIELKEVAVVRGIVIAGRSPVDDEEARSLRRAFSGDVEFYTYDDLLRDTTEIIRRIANA